MRTRLSLPLFDRETRCRHRRFQRCAEPAPPNRLRAPRRTAHRQSDLSRPSTVAELRYGALVAEWGSPRRSQLEQAIAATTVIPVSDGLLTTLAAVRFDCRNVGHPLADRVHANDLWIAASAIHVGIALVTADGAFAGVPRLTILN